MNPRLLAALAILALGLGGLGLGVLTSGSDKDATSGLREPVLDRIAPPDPVADQVAPQNTVTTADLESCPENRLPAEGAPVQGSVGLSAGGDATCSDIGMLNPLVFSLTDGATGLPVTELPSLNADAAGLEYLLSPDNTLLVVSAAPWLHVVDLQTWSQVHAVRMPAHPERLRSIIPLDPQFWSPDGSKVYLRLGWHTRSRTGPAVHNDRRIWRLDVGTGTLTALPDLPFDSLLQPAISEDGRLLFALAFDRDDRSYHWVARGDPFLSIVDLDSGQEVRRIPLPGLKIGVDDEDATHRPAAVLDDSAGRYYIAHAASYTITVVDLKTGRVVTQTSIAAGTRPGQSLPTRLLDGLTSIFVTKVEAKGTGFHTRQAGLNLDGSLLFVTGTDQTDEDPEGTTPTGLRIIDTQTLKLVHQEEGIGKFVISDDGRYLFGTGFSSYFENHWAPQDGIGLKVLDLHTMQLAAHIEPDKAYEQLALTLDGRYLHLTSEGPGRIQTRQEGQDSCDDPCIKMILDVVDLDSFSLLVRHELEVWVSPISNWSYLR